MEHTSETKVCVTWSLTTEEVEELRQVQQGNKEKASIEHEVEDYCWSLEVCTKKDGLPETATSDSREPVVVVYLNADTLTSHDLNRGSSDLAWYRGEVRTKLKILSPVSPRSIIATDSGPTQIYQAGADVMGPDIGTLDSILDHYDRNGSLAVYCQISSSSPASYERLSYTAKLMHFDSAAGADVVFRFPSHNEKPHVFALTPFLKLRSAYFATLFSSDFAETSDANSIAIDELTIPRSEPFTLDEDEFLPFYSSANVEAPPIEEDDPEPSIKSENDTPRDAVNSTHQRKRARVEDSSTSGSKRLMVVDIKETDFTTYRAMLAYLYTSAVPFTALPAEYLVARDTALAEHLPSDPSFVFQPPEVWLRNKFDNLKQQMEWEGILPCSPHSMYRLATCYGFKYLAELTKRRILRCVNVENVAYELFSPLSIDYEEIQKEVLGYFVEHWEEVKKTTAFKNVLDKIASGELSNARELIEKVWTMMKP